MRLGGWAGMATKPLPGATGATRCLGGCHIILGPKVSKKLLTDTSSTKLIGKFYMDSCTTCPICYSRQIELIYSLDSSEATRLLEQSKDTFRCDKIKSYIETIWGRAMCDVLHCRDCAFTFVDPFIAADAEFYSLLYDRASYPTWKWEHQITFETIQQLAKSNRYNPMLLEVGAGDGVFVEKIADVLVPKRNIVCTELSHYGISKLNHKGMVCWENDIRDNSMSRYEGVFDMVCMFQVIEHMDRLDVLFQRLSQITSPQAHLFIASPNHNHVDLCERAKVRLDIPPVHIGRWSEKAFEVISERFGWSIVRQEIMPESYKTRAYYFLLRGFLQTTLERKLDYLQLRQLRRSAKAIGLVIYSFSQWRTILALRSKTFGLNRWVHLAKKPALEFR
jgi:hypothetical protein